MQKVVLGLVLMLVPAAACAQSAVGDALRDSAPAQESQARSMERMERIQRDQARDLDRDRRNAARDSRSSCCKGR